MSDLKRSLNSEASALWAELFDEPAPSHLEGSELIGFALSQMDAESYRTIRRTHSRDADRPRAPSPETKARRLAPDPER